MDDLNNKNRREPICIRKVAIEIYNELLVLNFIETHDMAHLTKEEQDSLRDLWELRKHNLYIKPLHTEK